MDPVHRDEGRHPLRGAGRRREGRRDQAHHRAAERIARVVALGVPTEREKTQWYFQRYVAHLPAAGEMVLFDRSWYNRAGVERVMGFCTDDELAEFLRSCPAFEQMLIRSGITLIKYWFSVSDAEQEARFQARLNDPTKRWKLSPMDLESRARWVEWRQGRDVAYTDTKRSPWWVSTRTTSAARLNCISHLVPMISRDPTPEPIRLRARATGTRPPMADQTFVPEVYRATARTSVGCSGSAGRRHTWRGLAQ